MDLNDMPKHWSDCSVYKDQIVLGTECDCGGCKPKDLTDDEIRKLWSDAELDITWFTRAVIEKFKEKNK